MVQHPSAVGYHPQPVAPAAAPPGSAVHLHGVVAAPGALLHGSAQHPLPDTPQVPPTSAVNNSSVLPQLEVNPSAPVGPPTNNNLLLLTAENSELREKVAALTKDYNGEVEKLTTFKQSVMKILHEEREQLESEKSKIQAERDDLLYQGVDGEEVTLSLQRRLQAALAEIGSLGEISKEQDKALSFLIARRKNLEEFIMEGDKVMAEEVLGRLRSSSPSKEGPQGTTSSRKPSAECTTAPSGRGRSAAATEQESKSQAGDVEEGAAKKTSTERGEAERLLEELAQLLESKFSGRGNKFLEKLLKESNAGEGEPILAKEVDEQSSSEAHGGQRGNGPAGGAIKNAGAATSSAGGSPKSDKADHDDSPANST